MLARGISIPLFIKKEAYMAKNTLKPSQLALGENNPKGNEWHGVYEGPIEHTLEQGFFRAYYQQLFPGDRINMVCAGPNGQPDFIQLLVVANTADKNETIPKDEHIVVKPIISTDTALNVSMVDLKEFKEELKKEVLAELKKK